MKTPVPEDLALDGAGVRKLLADPLAAWSGVRVQSCSARLLKRTSKRLVVRYEFEGGGRKLGVVGKWYSTDRGALVSRSLSLLRAEGFAGPDVAVPELVVYVPDVRALFMEAVDGEILREAFRHDESSAARAGAWLAAFHRSSLSISRECGPAKMRTSVERWTRETPALATVAVNLGAALAPLANPALPVHFDYYHSQLLLVPSGPIVAFDLDEAGMGDPAFDLAHFEAHLALLALQWFGDPDRFARAGDAFRSGYSAVAPLPEAQPALAAFAWFKLAYQLLRYDAPRQEQDYALGAVRRSLSAL